MPERIEPMKSRLAQPDPGVPWEYEVKWDGYRAIAFCGDRFRLQGRRMNEVTPDFPELGELGKDAVARGHVLDGELIVFNEDGVPDFQLMQARRERQLQAHFMIFDLLWARGEDLRNLPYQARRAALEELRLEGSHWSVPERLDGSLGEVLAATDALGLEGVVAKDPESPYVSGRRSGYWVKVKHLRRQEFVVGGWLPGKGHRSGTLGALLLGYQDPGTRELRFAGRCGTGMDDERLRWLRRELEPGEKEAPFAAADLAEIPRDAVWAEPRIVVEVRFTQWTRDGRLRNPVFIGVRPDKAAAEVFREEAPTG